MATRPSAVVFGYHNVGVRCLKVLLAQGVHVPLVVTHEDDAREAIWFDSLSQLAAERGIAAITPENPAVPDVMARLRALAPDFIS